MCSLCCCVAAKMPGKKEERRVRGGSPSIDANIDIGSLIYTAAYHGHEKHLKKLLARGPWPAGGHNPLRWKHPHGGSTAVYVACEFKHHEALRLLLEAGAVADDPRDDGATPLYKACQDGHLNNVQLLLKHGAKVDQKDPNGMTPLWVACHQGRVELVEILLEAGADPSLKVSMWSPIMLAERDGRADLIALLRKYLPEKSGDAPEAAPLQSPERILIASAGRGDLVRVQQLIMTGADVNFDNHLSKLSAGATGDELWATALHAACDCGHAGMVELLLDGKAMPDAGMPQKMSEGFTPLALACDREGCAAPAPPARSRASARPPTRRTPASRPLTPRPHDTPPQRSERHSEAPHRQRRAHRLPDRQGRHDAPHARVQTRARRAGEAPARLRRHHRSAQA